jgi:hypothetical protein
MTRQHNTSESLKSIGGGALVGLGLHLFIGNLQGDAAQMSHLLGIAQGESLGVLPSIVLATSQAVRVYGADHQGLSQGLLWVLLSFWPLLLVIAGTTLLRDVFTDRVKALPTSDKELQKKDIGCRFHCPSFDV